MKIHVHNDGKETDISCYAIIDGNEQLGCGYGYTAKEAINDLQIKIIQYMNKLRKIDYDNFIYVDCFNKPVDKP